jgi:hypothetical protein
MSVPICERNASTHARSDDAVHPNHPGSASCERTSFDDESASLKCCGDEVTFDFARSGRETLLPSPIRLIRLIAAWSQICSGRVCGSSLLRLSIKRGSAAKAAEAIVNKHRGGVDGSKSLHSPIQDEASSHQIARHPAPNAIARHESIRRRVSLSRRNRRPMIAANTTLVSRSADTSPMASYCIAQMTMP